MGNLELSSWNPLDFLEDDPPDSTILDESEIVSLANRTKAIAVLNSVELTGQNPRVVGREVGDDRVDLSRSPDSLCCMLAVQEDVVHMVTSAEDTGVRLRLWNFCEVTSTVPTDPSQGYDFVRKDGDFSKLGYNDSIILRILLDVQKGDGEEHSSTEPGKMSMLGARLSTPRKELRGMWQIASLFQDAMLCTHKASEPKYLPPLMGGTGVTALFDNPDNVFYYVLAYRGGTYRRIYATAVAEAASVLYSMERGVQTAPVLCPRLREKQEYFWGTYDNFVFIPKPDQLKTEAGLAPPIPLYTATGGSNRYQNYETRLIRTRLVVTKRAAEREWEHTRRLHSIFHNLFPKMEDYDRLDKDRARASRAKYNNALSANSALQNLLRREATMQDARQMMGDANFYTLTTGKRDFTRLDALWIYNNGQGENYSLRDVSLSEDIYVREEVSVEETFKVAGLPLRPMIGTCETIRTTKTKVGLYQINSNMEEWSEDLLNRLLKERDRLGRSLDPQEMGPICDEDPEWVNDDSGLIARCHRECSGHSADYTVFLISNDKRLANQMAETCNVKVIRIRPREYVVECASRGLDPKEAYPDVISKRTGVLPTHVYIDTGSISADAVHLEKGDDDKIVHRAVTQTGWNAGKRFAKVKLTKLEERVRFKTYRHYPVTRPKLWRAGSRPVESVYSSHSSWKRNSSESSRSSWWRSSLPPA